MTPARSLDFVFLVGFPRSGTTLLATMLDRHSQMAATPETGFFIFLAPRKVGPDRVYKSEEAIGRFLANYRVADLGLSADDFSIILNQDKCTMRDTFSRALSAYGERRGARIVVEKTPAHMGEIDRILEWFPSAKIVHIVRDGRDSVLSLIDAPWTHTNLRRHAANWRWDTTRLRHFQQMNPAAVYELRYEDLLRNPESSLRGVCNYIGVEFEPSQTQSRSAGGPVTKWEMDWKRKALEKLDPSRIHAWRRTASANQRRTMNSIMGDMLREYGYPDTRVEDFDRSILHRARNAVADYAYVALLHPRVRRLGRARIALSMRRMWARHLRYRNPSARVSSVLSH